MEDYDEDYGDEYGDEWLYVEEYYDEADQLAECTCPSPSYNTEGTYPEDDDMFNYWADLEYLSDGGYHDKGDPDKPSKKRKLETGASSERSDKRPRKEKSATRSYDPVIWMSFSERQAATTPRVLSDTGKLRSIGLLRDWETKLRDQRGLATFPEGDFQLQDSQDQEGESEDEDMEGEGFDLGDLKQVAELLSGDEMDALQKIMQAKGMDASAVEEVLKDMLAGREREFSEEEEGEDDEEEAGNQADEDEFKEHGMVDTNPAPTKSRQADTGQSGTRPSPNFKSSQHSAHGGKRKAPDDDHDVDADDVPHNFTPKRRKAGEEQIVGSGRMARRTRTSKRMR